MKQPPPFSAVLLAGGKSSRMGRDKAGVVIDGLPLWQRQLATLRAAGACDIFISGKRDGPYANANVPMVCDTEPDLGPLAGIAAALNTARHELLLVLAIDLPAMSPEFLSALVLAVSTWQTGIIPRSEGWFEPLAAVYPRACLPLVAQCLHSADRSMQRFVRMAVEQGFISIRELSAIERPLFKNINRPGDLILPGG